MTNKNDNLHTRFAVELNRRGFRLQAHRSTFLTFLITTFVVVLMLGGGAIAVAAPTVPGAPNGLLAVTNSAGRAATISWSPPASTGGATVTGYTVARDGFDSNGSGPWSTTVGAGDRSFSFTNLVSGREYTLTVRAVNSAGAGAAASTKVTLTVPALPGIPTGTPVAVAQQNDSATVSWAPPANTGGLAVTGYVVGHNGLDRDGIGPWSTTVSAIARSFTFTRLGPNGDTATIRAVTAAGTGPAAFIAIFTGLPLIVMQPVANLTVVTNRGTGTATVNWSLGYPGNHYEAPAGFNVGRDGTDSHGGGAWSTTLPASARTFTFSYLRPGVTYTLTVTGFVRWSTQVSTQSVRITI